MTSPKPSIAYIGQGPNNTCCFKVDGIGNCTAQIIYAYAGSRITATKVTELSLNNEKLRPQTPTYRRIADLIEKPGIL